MAPRVLTSGEGSDALSERPARLLLVNRDPRNLAYYQLILQLAGYSVRACDSYGEACAAIASDRFDMAVVDQGGSDFEGKIVLQRAVESDHHAPVLVLARFMDTTCYLEAMQLGAVDYLEEPVNITDLIHAVTTHLRNSREHLLERGWVNLVRVSQQG